MTDIQPTKDDTVNKQLDSSKKLKLPEVLATTNKELMVIRTFDAPKELVFKMFTEAEHLKHWYGNYQTTVSSCEVDLRIGGKLTIVLKMPNGFTSTLEGIIYEIIDNEKFIFSMGGFKDNLGKSAVEFLNMVTLTDYKGKTKLTLQCNVIKAEVDKPEMAVDGMLRGWPDSLENLEAYIEKQLH